MRGGRGEGDVREERRGEGRSGERGREAREREGRGHTGGGKRVVRAKRGFEYY